MVGDWDREKEMALVEFLAEITSQGSLDNLLQLLIEKAPGILEVNACSVYLTQEFVPQYNGELIDSDLQTVPGNMVFDNFVVLAQTNNMRKQKYIGKIYYPSGHDLPGWVFKTGRILRCKNSRDCAELQQIDPQLMPSVLYKILDPNTEEVTPILYVPLQSGPRRIGVLKLHSPTKLSGFTETDEKIATIISQVIAGVAQKIQIVFHQGKQILSLAELGAEENVEEVFRKVTRSVVNLMESPRSQLYLRQKNTNLILLAYENGRSKAPTPARYARGDGLIGWVYKTGASLCVEDLHDYLDERYLDDELLTKISDQTSIEESDRRLVAWNQDFIRSIPTKIPFMAVPVFANDGSIQGVLCTHFLTKHYVKRQAPFNEIELQTLKTLASTISLAIGADRSRRKGEILLSLNSADQLDELFDMASRAIPDLIYETDCFIFETKYNGYQKILSLKSSNRKIVDLQYEFGVGKTGFAALSGETLVIDHYGNGNINLSKIDHQKSLLRRTRPNCLFHDLQDQAGNCVGLIKLCNGRLLDTRIQAQFSEFCETIAVVNEDGLASENIAGYLDMGSKPSFSFAAVPISVDNNQLAGVITIARPMDENPFASEDVEFVQSVARTFANVINILQLQEHREQLFINLAHEVDINLTSILADTENLVSEIVTSSNLQYTGQHLIGQVQRLNVMTAMILAAFESRLGAITDVENLEKILDEAVSIYIDEANEKKCSISNPIAIGYPKFPFIEMNRRDLTLALRVILHNAIKYSLRPQNNGVEKNPISIIGEWHDDEKEFYCLSIRNIGVQISQEEIDKRLIFQPFYRGAQATSLNRTGSGIGLTFVQMVLEKQHGGKILVDSISTENGLFATTFKIILPVKHVAESR